MAAPIFTATPSGDWFDGASWSGGVAPGASDEPVIDNGATATGSSDSPLYSDGAVTVQSLTVGSRLDPARPADASGEVAFTDVDLVVTGNLSLGAISTDVAESTNTISGSLTVSGGNNFAGDVSSGETLVGAIEGDGHEAPEDGSIAVGTLTADGTLTATRALHVGVTNAATGSASGQVSIGGDARILAQPNPFTPQSPVVSTDVKIGVSSALNLGSGQPQTTLGSMTVAGDMESVYAAGQTPYVTALLVGGAVLGGLSDPAADASGLLDVGENLRGFFSVQVGLASTSFGVGSQRADGELHVAGTLGAVTTSLSPGVFPELNIGATIGAGQSSASATIGAIEAGDSRTVRVAYVSGSGSATGELEIGSGYAGAASAGAVDGDGVAEGRLVTGGGFKHAIVGMSGPGYYGYDFPQPVGKAVGSLYAGGSLLDGARVGVVNGDGTASGTVSVEGIGGGSLADVTVGWSTVGAGAADGHLLVRSGGISTSQILVGALRSAQVSLTPPTNADVRGVLESTGNVSSLSASSVGDVVGWANARSGGKANGTWILHDGTYTGRKLSVGVNLGTSTVSGTIHLDHMLIDVDNLILGDGARVELEIDGILRGDEYSAIDATIAALDGSLTVEFTSPVQLGVYDLLVSGGSDGITGGFDSVTVLGLGANQSAFWGIESVGATNAVEVFRLYVVPEPGTGALLAFGLLVLRVLAQRTSNSRVPAGCPFSAISTL